MSNLNDDELMRAAMGDLDDKQSSNSNKNLSRCNVCNGTFDTDANFCPNCGAKIGAESQVHKEHFEKDFKDAINKVKQNEFVKSVKQDVGNIQSFNMIKGKIKTTDSNQKKRFIIIGIVILIIIVLLIIVTHIHQCDECDKVYFGSKHTVTYWGETENWCKECYEG